MASPQTGWRLLETEHAAVCHIVGRMNRFVVEVRQQSHRRRAYLANTGRLEELLVAGRKAYCLPHGRPARTDCRLFAVEDGSLAAVVDTQLQMLAFEEAVRRGLLPWLEGFRIRRRNVRLGDSVIDYLLECQGRDVYLEVKSAALRGGAYAMYPDCPSLRGRRHIRELTRHVRRGGRAALLFVGAVPGVSAFRPNRRGDPEIPELLHEARRAGVSLRAMAMAYDPGDSFIRLTDPDLPVEL
jgi:sugar fermentation stimulation protein A